MAELLETQESKDRFMHILADNDALALAGRGLFTIFERGNA